MSLAETRPDDQLSLDIPLDAAHILIARLFVGAVARSLELGEETADVLRLTLTEVCSEAVDRIRDGRIAIDVSAEAVPIHVNVVAIGIPHDGPGADATEATYRRTLIEALVPDVTFVVERGRLNVMFTL